MRYTLDFLGTRPAAALETVIAYQKHLIAAKAQIQKKFGDVKIPQQLEEDLEYADFCNDRLSDSGAVSFADEAAEFIKRAYVFKLEEINSRIAQAKGRGATEEMLEDLLREQVEVERVLAMAAYSRIQTRPPYHVPQAPSNLPAKEYDVFISHASEDKDAVARPLAEALVKRGLKVWYDETHLTVGDSLRRSIDLGLAKSKFGVVILSDNFFRKHWPQQELNGLAAKEVAGQKVILPVWHGITHEEIARESPTLADRMGTNMDRGLARVVDDLITAITPGTN